ncbi:hypothetical protein Gasu2_01780 [Galdieria sulphuraria]|nr:hypothetical protein Gasu2_01780 [Galdieria sulphuraria]
MIQAAIQVFSEASRCCKTTKEPNKRKRIVATAPKDGLTCDVIVNSCSKESFLCCSFRESWERIKDEFYLSIQKHKEQVVQNIYRVLKETFVEFSLPIVSLSSDETEHVYPHLVQQVLDYSQKVDSNFRQLVIRLRSTDFQSLSLAVRALVEQCISKEIFKDYLPELSQNDCIKVDPGSVEPPADFLLQWYHDVSNHGIAVNVIILIEDIYLIPDSILIKFIQWISALRKQRVKFCLFTFANEELSLFKAKVECQGRFSIAFYPVHDSTSTDALIQVLENIFVFRVPPFDISSQVLSFLRKKVTCDKISVFEFLRFLKLIWFDFFSSNPLKYLKDNESIFQDKHLHSILEKQGIKTFDEFNVHMQRTIRDKNVAHGILQWISKDILTSCSIYAPPLDLYEAALNGVLSKEKSMENIKSALYTHVPASKLSETLTKWWLNLEPQLEGSEWRKEIEESFSKLIHISEEGVSDNTEMQESSLKTESCLNRNWNAAKRRKAMLQTLRKRPNGDINRMHLDVMHLLLRLVNFIDQTFSNPFAQLFTYSSFTRLLQISGYNTLCRKQWLTRNKDNFECSKYHQCIVCSMPKGKKRIGPIEWFEKSLQMWIEKNNYTDDLSSSERDKLWIEFWKKMMELQYCGVIHLSQKRQLLIERTIFD